MYFKSQKLCHTLLGEPKDFISKKYFNPYTYQRLVMSKSKKGDKSTPSSRRKRQFLRNNKGAGRWEKKRQKNAFFL